MDVWMIWLMDSIVIVVCGIGFLWAWSRSINNMAERY